MKLIFIRHGDAGAYTSPDSERQLSPLGQWQATQTGQWLASHYQAWHIITSPYSRARQTAEIIADCQLSSTPSRLPSSPSIQPPKPLRLSVCDGITPDDDPAVGLQAIAKLIDDTTLLGDGVVMVVCHMNIIAKMTALLTGEPPCGFGLAEARVLELAMIANDSAYLDRHFCP